MSFARSGLLLNKVICSYQIENHEIMFLIIFIFYSCKMLSEDIAKLEPLRLRYAARNVTSGVYIYRIYY